MFKTNEHVVKIKSACQQFRKFVNYVITLLVIFAFIYFIYYQMMVNDQWEVFKDTRPLFLPLANFFTPDNTSDEVFLYTTFYLLGCTIPVALLYYVADFVKDILIKLYIASEDRAAKRSEEIAKKNELLQYEVIKYLSICFSFDWKSENELTQDAKNKLNAGIFSKIKKAISANAIKKDMRINKYFAVKLESFRDFDSLFEILVNIIAKIKSQIEAGGNLEMIPTIYADAYVEPESFENIEKNFSEIMKFNLSNKALSSQMFVKKYEFLQLKKYRGYSVGDYASFEGNKIDNFEVNVIYNDLNEILLQKSGRA